MDPPPSPPPGDAARVLLATLVRLARERDDVREALEALRRWLDAALRPSAQAGGERRPWPVLRDDVLTPAADRRTSAGRGGREGEAPAREERRVDLGAVVRRARWKAAACRLAVDRRRAAQGGADATEVQEREARLRQERERLEDCYAWMLDTQRPLPADDLLGDVADCYETLALAAEVTAGLQEKGVLDSAPPAALLYLLAEAQSALLAALNKCDQRGDSDQRELFVWLKDQTTRHRIYVDRHMRLDDPADSRGSADLAARLSALGEEAGRRHRRRQLRGQLLNKVRYHARKSEQAGAAADQDWSAVETAVEAWLEHGLSPGDAALGAALRGFLEHGGPDREPGEGLRTVLEASAARATGDAPQERAAPEAGRAVAVEQARELLAGRTLVVLGEASRAEAAEALRAALDLRAVEWTALGEAALETVSATVQRPEVDLVLIAVRLEADLYQGFKTLCMEHDKPFVRLPAGVDPPQVAHQILRQVGWRLRERQRT